jgi:acetylornithine deacetylase/succinyl-diaminopimelate desuccinylase-like protein
MSLAVAEKGVLWLEVGRDLVGGHGAGISADAELTAALRRLLDLPRRLPGARFHPLVAEHVRWYLKALPGRPRTVPTRAEEVDPAFDYMIRTTLNLTSVDTDGGDNVLPGRIRGTFDVRTLDPADHPAVKEMVRTGLPGWAQQVRLELPPAPPSDPAHPLFRRLLNTLDRALPGIPKGPALLGGFSDLRHLRQKGIPAYGFSPFFLNYYHEGTVHTRKEAIPRDRFLEGVDLMRSVVHSLCAE